MRRLVMAAMVVGLSQGAQAADWPDMPILRGALRDGPSPVRRWDGYYVGGQFGQTSGKVDYGHALKSLTDYIYRNSVLQDPVGQLQTLAGNNAASMSYGGFVGRNFQWSEAVIGIELNYNHMPKFGSWSSDSISRSFVNPTGSTPPSGHTYTYNVGLTGDATVNVYDVATLRGRAGWAMGDFLPYAFGGAVVGRLGATRSVTAATTLYDDYNTTSYITDGNGNSIAVQVPQRDVYNWTTASRTEVGKSTFVGGYTFGVGSEFMLFSNLFARVEWEYVKFLAIKDINLSMNSIRAGLGYKF